MMDTDVSQVKYSNTNAANSTELPTPNATPASSTNDNSDVLLRDLTPLFTYLFSSDLMSSPSSPHSNPTTATTAAATIVRPMNDQMQNITVSNIYRDLLNRYRVTLIRVKDLIRENNALRQDNNVLRSAYEDLNHQFNCLFSQPCSLHSCILSASSSSNSSFGSSQSSDCYNGGEIFSDFSPTNVLDELDNYRNVDRFDEEDRLSLPKSISVRSSDYMKMQWPLLNNNSSHLARDWNLQLNINGSPTPPIQFDTDRTGRKRMEVDEKEMMTAAEMSISKQGMYKTELCKNWRQKGNCPYGMSCQFAHGVSELRPVIRHQKYKTEVCRMILTIGRCPYGHRCHFRHSLTPQ